MFLNTPQSAGRLAPGFAELGAVGGPLACAAALDVVLEAEGAVGIVGDEAVAVGRVYWKVLPEIAVRIWSAVKSEIGTGVLSVVAEVPLLVMRTPLGPPALQAASVSGEQQGGGQGSEWVGRSRSHVLRERCPDVPQAARAFKRFGPGAAAACPGRRCGGSAGCPRGLPRVPAPRSVHAGTCTP